MDHGSDIQGDHREGKVRKGGPQERVTAADPGGPARTGWVGRACDRTICFSYGSAPEDTGSYPLAPSCMFKELGSGQHVGEPFYLFSLWKTKFDVIEWLYLRALLLTFNLVLTFSYIYNFPSIHSFFKDIRFLNIIK